MVFLELLSRVIGTKTAAVLTHAATHVVLTSTTPSGAEEASTGTVTTGYQREGCQARGAKRAKVSLAAHGRQPPPQPTPNDVTFMDHTLID